MGAYLKKLATAAIVATVGSACAHALAFTVEYDHPALRYADSGIQIYSMPAKDFLAKGYSGQVSYLKSKTNGKTVPFVLGQTGDFLGGDKNDLFTGYVHFRTNRVIGGKGDDFYEVQHTFNIVEKPGEGADTYFTSGNTWPGKENVENLISAGAGGRVYGNSGSNLIITEGKGSEIHGGPGNDVLLVNGPKDSFFGEDGTDTIVFPGKLNDYRITGDPWGVTVKNSKTGGSWRLGHHDIEQIQFDDAFFGYGAGANVLSVGPNKAFAKVSDALHVAGDGDVIEADSGVYEDDFAIIDRSVKIVGKNGRAHFYAKSDSFKGKANFITYKADVTFENVEFSGNKVGDRNGAGIRFEGGKLTVRNSYFHNNQVGILGGNWPDGVVTIENTEFGNNGHFLGGNPHTLNLGIIKELNVRKSYFHDSHNGHNIRSMADTLNVTDSFFADGSANTSFNIEVARALNSNITGNTFVQGELGENTHMVLNTATVSSVISNNFFVNASSKGVSAVNSASNTSISLNGNRLYNYQSFVGGTGKFTWTNNQVVTSANVTFPTPYVPVGNVQYPSTRALPPTNGGTPLPPVVVSTPGEFQNEATIASFTGKDLSVGAGKTYSTLKDAVNAAASGDKIYVSEGTYSGDYAIISNKNLAIVGLGKGAEFKKTVAIPNGKAIIVSHKSNVFIQNVTFSDAEVPDKNGAGIRYEGGTLTVLSSTFRNCENGILGGATEVGKGKVWIRGSKFLDNGRNGTGYTHAIYIGEMDYFKIVDSTVRGTSVGHHVKSRARQSVIENNVLDDAGKDASYNIDLPNGGEALVRGNTIIQSEKSPNRTMVSYSAEKNPPNAGKLVIENNVFESFGTTAVGVKNHGTNQVILRGNTFKNVSTKFVGKVVEEK